MEGTPVFFAQLMRTPYKMVFLDVYELFAPHVRRKLCFCKVVVLTTVFVFLKDEQRLPFLDIDHCFLPLPADPQEHLETINDLPDLS